MAVTLEIDESNQSGGEVVHDAIPSIAFGITDAWNQDPVANAVTPGGNSMEKWLRLHFTSLGAAAAVGNLKVWAAAPPANITLGYNGALDETTYDGANHKQTTFAAPATTATRTPETLPTSEPASANLGIGGNLTGQLTAPGRSDYYVLQGRVGASATTGFTSLVFSFGYEAVA